MVFLKYMTVLHCIRKKKKNCLCKCRMQGGFIFELWPILKEENQQRAVDVPVLQIFPYKTSGL
jgi:hypothetical protein